MQVSKAPVRVKLERINCNVAKSFPPDGDHPVWFDRLMAACGERLTGFHPLDFVSAPMRRAIVEQWIVRDRPECRAG